MEKKQQKKNPGKHNTHSKNLLTSTRIYNQHFNAEPFFINKCSLYIVLVEDHKEHRWKIHYQLISLTNS